MRPILHAQALGRAHVRPGLSQAGKPEDRGMKPQLILHNFEDAVEKAGRVCQLAKGREVNGMVECVKKLVNAERLKAVHILAAADVALKELQ
jgi:hypothetical protein